MARFIRNQGRVLRVPDDATDEQIVEIIKQRPEPEQPSAKASQRPLADLSPAEALADIPMSVAQGTADLATNLLLSPIDMLRMSKESEDAMASTRDQSKWYNKPLNEYLFSPEVTQGIDTAREATFNAADTIRSVEHDAIWEPRTGTGEFARDITPWVAPALAAPSKAAAAKQGVERLLSTSGDVLAQGLLPYGAYRGTKELGGNDAAAMLASLFTGVGATGLKSARTADTLLARDYRGTTDTTWDAMQALEQEQKGFGQRLTPAETHAQVTGQTSSGPLLTQRYLEATPVGQQVIAPQLAERGNEVARALETHVLDPLAPPITDPHMIGPQVSEAATQVRRGAEAQRTAAEQPHYRAADPTDVDVQALDDFVADLDAEIAQYTPTNPHRQVLEAFRNRFVQTPAVPEVPPSRRNPTGTPAEPEVLAYDRRNLDSIKKEFRDATKQGEVGATGIAANTKGILGSHLERLDNILREEGSATPSPGAQSYRTATDTHANVTEMVVDPITQGPVGQIEKAQTTPAVGDILFPQKQPIANDLLPMQEAVTAIQQHTNALPAAARQQIEQLFAEVQGKTRSGNREWIGADLAKALASDPAKRARTRGILESMGQHQVAADLDRIIEGWQAMGKRLPPNSATAQNIQRSSELETSLPGEALANIQTPWNVLGDLYRQFRLAGNQRRAAELAYGPVADTRAAAATDWRTALPPAAVKTGLSALYEGVIKPDEKRGPR